MVATWTIGSVATVAVSGIVAVIGIGGIGGIEGIGGAERLFAQDAEPPAYIALVEGTATVERDGQQQPATINAPIVPGDHLRTESGRIEVLFPDGSALDVDELTALDIQSPTLLRLTSGRVIATVSGAGDRRNAVAYEIDTPDASVSTAGPGEYRVSVLGPPSSDAYTELVVFRGNASLTNDRGTVPLRAGERSLARVDQAPASPQRVNSARLDAFGEWSAAQRTARVGTTSAQHLPSNLQMYGATFDQYGDWQYSAPYGYVWYPRVDAGWRPYYNGFWSPVQPYGWTWIGVDVWAWPTHHYGRWGFARNAWFWIPQRTWAPAWVSWGAAPGYVSWCPLGFDNRPVFASSAGIERWVVIPRATFGVNGYYVNRHAVAPRDLPRTTAFVVQNTPPVSIPRRAVARPQADIVPPAAGIRRAPDSRAADAPRIAIPRGTAPAAATRYPTAPADESRSAVDDRRVTIAPAAPRARETAAGTPPRAGQPARPNVAAPVAAPPSSRVAQPPRPEVTARTPTRSAEPANPEAPPVPVPPGSRVVVPRTGPAPAIAAPAIPRTGPAPSVTPVVPRSGPAPSIAAPAVPQSGPLPPGASPANPVLRAAPSVAAPAVPVLRPAPNVAAPAVPQAGTAPAAAAPVVPRAGVTVGAAVPRAVPSPPAGNEGHAQQQAGRSSSQEQPAHGDASSRSGNGATRSGDGASHSGDGANRSGDGGNHSGDGASRSHGAARSR